MTLLNLLSFTMLCAIGYLFWQNRSISEAAVAHVTRYCDKHNLQMISVARKKTRIAVIAGKLGWKTEFEFEFSGNKENKYAGVLCMSNRIATSIDVPAYRID